MFAVAKPFCCIKKSRLVCLNIFGSSTHRHQTKVALTPIIMYFLASSAFAPLRPLACGVGVGVGGAGSGGRSGGEEGGSGTAERHEDVKHIFFTLKKILPLECFCKLW